jgi:transcriptional regulator with XRE-family HTH domain
MITSLGPPLETKANANDSPSRSSSSPELSMVAVPVKKTVGPSKKGKADPSRYRTEQVGARLRELRVRRKMTINQLAELSNVPASTISKIENDQLRPSLVHAINLASSLNENLGFLIEEFRNRPQPVSIVRADQRDTIDYPDMGLTLQDLSGHFISGVLEARLGVLASGTNSGVGEMKHPGEEFCLVIAGSIRYRIDGESYTLSVGEYLHFKSTIPHSWENSHTGETRILQVFSDGLSF